MNAKFRAFLLTILLAPMAALANETVSIGSETLSIPLPPGFARLDGVNPDVDALMKSIVTPKNRLLLLAAPPELVKMAKEGNPQDMARYFGMQTYRDLESKTGTLKDFENASAQLEKEFSVGSATLAKAQSEANAQFKKSELTAGMQVGQIRPLGVFDKTDRSIDFGMLTVNQMAGEKPFTIVAGASAMLVRGKLVYLYAYSDFNGEADTAWVRSSVKSWRESILAANPGGTPEGGFDFGKIGRTAAIGGIIGGIVAIMAARKKKQNQVPPPPV
jgi:hypothetical protein